MGQALFGAIPYNFSNPGPDPQSSELTRIELATFTLGSGPELPKNYRSHLTGPDP